MAESVELSIAESFDMYFRVLVATDKMLANEAFSIRYQVYCQELGWEPSNDAGLETDGYDAQSIHCLLQHKRTGAFAGCVRVVKTSTSEHAPFEDNCLDSIKKDVIDMSTIERGQFAEISRLAVPETFRRRPNEKKIPFVIETEMKANDYSMAERRNFPNIAIGLYLASIACVDKMQLDYVFVMMEPRLRRHLTRFGLPFNQGGEVMDYHGSRALFYLPKEELTKNFSDSISELYELIYTSVSKGL